MHMRYRSCFFYWRNQVGFTLVELLVVIAVVGVLASIALISINPLAQFARARDSQRVSDIKQIADAVRRNYAINGGVAPPGAPDGTDASVTGCWGAWNAGTKLLSSSHPFIPALASSGELKALPIENHPISPCTVGFPDGVSWCRCSYRYQVYDFGGSCGKYAVAYTMLEKSTSKPNGPDSRPACVAAAGWGEGSLPDDFAVYTPVP